MTSALTPEQESVAHKIDTLGLGLIGAGVAGGLMHQHGAPGGLVQALGRRIHDAGPYLDLAGLSLIAPPVMNPLAKKLAPKAEEVLGVNGNLGAEPSALASPHEAPPRALGEIPVAGQSEDPLEQAKIASYRHGARVARSLFRTTP
jgi:hypothetical protein